MVKKSGESNYLSPSKAFELKQLRAEEKQRKQERELALRRYEQTRRGRLNAALASFARNRARSIRINQKIYGRPKPRRILPTDFKATALENRTIPDTTGRFDLGGLHREMDDAANLVP